VTIFTLSPAIRHYSCPPFYAILNVDYNSGLAFPLLDKTLQAQESNKAGRTASPSPLRQTAKRRDYFPFPPEVL